MFNDAALAGMLFGGLIAGAVIGIVCASSALIRYVRSFLPAPAPSNVTFAPPEPEPVSVALHLGGQRTVPAGWLWRQRNLADILAVWKYDPFAGMREPGDATWEYRQPACVADPYGFECDGGFDDGLALVRGGVVVHSVSCNPNKE
jgi:hypothetical protein